MQLVFGARLGDEKNFKRNLKVHLVDEEGPRVSGPFLLTMATPPGGPRLGRIASLNGKILWEGKLPDGPPPTRAFALAAGLCDENGNSEIEPPEWLK